MQPYFYGVPTYSIFASVGLFAMMLFLYFRCVDLEYKQFLILILFMAVGVGIGSKGLFVITRIPEIVHNFTLRNLMHAIVTSGFVFYGGLFGAIAGACLFAKIFHKDRYQILNMTSAGFAMFHIFGRFGCFFAGCCYGKKSTWGIPMAETPEIVRIPVQLIESACIAGNLCVILIVEKILGTRQYSLRIYLGCYAVSRFCLEFWRDDSIRGIWGIFSTSQWVSLFIFSVVLMECINDCVRVKRERG